LVPPEAPKNVEANSIQSVLAKPVAGASSVFEKADLAGSGKSEEQTDKLVGKKDLEALIAAPTFDQDLGSEIKATLIDKWDDAEFQRKYLTNGYLDPAKIQTEVSSTSVSQSPDDSDLADKNILAKGLDWAKEHPAEAFGAGALLTVGGILGWKTIFKNGVKEVVENPAAISTIVTEGVEGAGKKTIFKNGVKEVVENPAAISTIVTEGVEGAGKTIVTEGVEGAGKTIVTEGVEGAGKTIVTEGVEGAGKTIVTEGVEGAGKTIVTE
jgi:F0F1-type ATP synthase membrane subunit c/vacuolar-type H+-ATPase subunit K